MSRPFPLHRLAPSHGRAPSLIAAAVAVAAVVCVAFPAGQAHAQSRIGGTGLSPASPASPTRPARRGASAALTPPATGLLAAPRATAPGDARAQQVRSANFIVALVNSEPITAIDVQTRVERVLANGSDPALKKLPKPELARLALERLVMERVQLQEAKELGIKIDDIAVDQAEESVARQNGISVAEMRRQASAGGLNESQLRDELRSQLVFTQLRQREVENKVKVTDQEVAQYLEQQRQGGGAATAAPAGPSELNLSQVLVAVPEKASAADVAALQKRAEALAARARAGEDFAKLVREASDSPDKAAGGSLGLRPIDRVPSLFVEATRETPVGGVAGPVRSGAGFHILKVVAKESVGSAAAVMQTHARHILLRTDDGRMDTPTAVAKLTDLKRRIDSGSATFAEMARDNSQDGSAKDGGDLGWVNPGQFVPEFEEVMDRLPPGKVSDPVVSRFGVHLIEVLDRRQAKLTEEQQRERIRAQLREKRLDQAYENWLQDLRARAYVEMREAPTS